MTLPTGIRSVTSKSMDVLDITNEESSDIPQRHITKSGQEPNFYVNGVLSGTPNQNSGTPEAGTTNLAIGNDTFANRSFDGTIDDVRIYNRVLSAQEVKRLYNMGHTGP